MHIARSLRSIRSFVGIVPLALLAAVAPACGGSAPPPPAEETLDFGDVFAGNPTTQSITVQNDEKKAFRYKPLVLVASGGDVFTTSSNCGAPLQPSQFCDVKVIAKGDALGPVTGDLYVFTDSGDVEAIDAALRVGAVDRVLGPKDKHYRLRAKVIPPHRLATELGSMELLRESNLTPFMPTDLEMRNTGIAPTPEPPGSTVRGGLADRFEVTPCAEPLAPNASCKVKLRVKSDLDVEDFAGDLEISGVTVKVSTQTARRWLVEARPSPTDVDLVSVSTDGDDLWAVGAKGTLLRSKTGEAWTVEPSVPVATPSLVVSRRAPGRMMIGGKEVTVMGPSRATIVAGAEGAYVSEDGGPFVAMSTERRSDTWVFGSIGATEDPTRPGAAVTRYEIVSSKGTSITSRWGGPTENGLHTRGVPEIRGISYVSGARGTVGIVLGPNGTTVCEEWDGGRPIATYTELGTSVQLRAIHGDIAVGDDGAAYKLSRQSCSWTQLETNTTAGLRAVVADDEVAVTAGNGVVALAPLGGLAPWRSFDAPNGAVLRSGTRFKGEVFFVGDKGAIVRVRAVTR